MMKANSTNLKGLLLHCIYLILGEKPPSPTIPVFNISDAALSKPAEEGVSTYTNYTTDLCRSIIVLAI